MMVLHKEDMKVEIRVNHIKGQRVIIEQWLDDNINKGDWKWIISESLFFPEVFYFNNEKDKVKFILKWK